MNIHSTLNPDYEAVFLGISRNEYPLLIENTCPLS